MIEGLLYYPLDPERVSSIHLDPVHESPSSPPPQAKYPSQAPISLYPNRIESKWKSAPCRATPCRAVPSDICYLSMYLDGGGRRRVPGPGPGLESIEEGRRRGGRVEHDNHVPHFPFLFFFFFFFGCESVNV